MAADEPICPECGKPLTGRDRFEGKCAACRERDVLGEPPPEEGEEAASQPGPTCPACGAENPVGLEHCMACDARLRPRRVRVLVLAAACVAAGLLAGVAVLIAWWPHPRPRTVRGAGATSLRPLPSPLPPRVATAAVPAPQPTESRAHLVPRVREETRVLIDLLHGKAYDKVIDNYCQPNEAEFARVESLLEQILHGDAKAGLLRWKARLKSLDEAKAREQLTEAGDRHPDYTVALLTHLTRDPDASGGHLTAEDRARGLLAWHLAGLFEGVDLARAEIRDVEDRGRGPFVVPLDCGGKPREPRPGDDPKRILWVKRPDSWLLQLAVGDRLRDVHALLKRSAP